MEGELQRYFQYCSNLRTQIDDFFGKEFPEAFKVEVFRLAAKPMHYWLTDGDANSEKSRAKEAPATEKQIALLKKLGISFDSNVSLREASNLIDAKMRKRDA